MAGNYGKFYVRTMRESFYISFPTVLPFHGMFEYGARIMEV